MVKTLLVTPTFWLLLDCACKVSRLYLSLLSPSPTCKLELSKRLKEDIARTGVLSCWKEYFLPQDTVLSSRNLGRVEGGDNWVYGICLAKQPWTIIISIHLSCFLSVSSQSHRRVEWASGCVGVWLLARINQYFISTAAASWCFLLLGKDDPPAPHSSVSQVQFGRLILTHWSAVSFYWEVFREK